MVLELSWKVVGEVGELSRHQQLVCGSVKAQLDYVAKYTPGRQAALLITQKRLRLRWATVEVE